MYELYSNSLPEEVAFRLINNVLTQEASPDILLEVIPSKISLNQDNLAQKLAIEMLIEYGKENEVINRLDGNIELVNTSKHGKNIIISLLKSKKFRDVIEKFSTPFQLDKMDLDEYMFFRQALPIKPDLAEYIGQAFPNHQEKG